MPDQAQSDPHNPNGPSSDYTKHVAEFNAKVKAKNEWIRTHPEEVAARRAAAINGVHHYAGEGKAIDEGESRT
ncbi:hypothetical protein LCGC14_2574200 [marine sediment metagenome]|uniref:Uncharacterized protein n=1 Tax=marine sediment metagenome TaxID=412755 RepID=A0A0F9D947_9ZZZZ